MSELLTATKHLKMRPSAWSIRTRLTVFTLALSLAPVLVLAYVGNTAAAGALANSTFLVILITVLGLAGLCLAMATSITAPIRQAVKAADRLALGDLEDIIGDRDRSSLEALSARRADSSIVETPVCINDRVIAERKQLASLIASNELVIAAAAGLRHDPNALNQVLASYWRSNKHFTGVFLMDSTGRCIAAAGQQPGKNYSFRPYFQEAMKGNLYSSDLSLSIDTFSPQVVHAAPVKYRGEVVGVLALRSDGADEFPLVSGQDGDSGTAFGSSGDEVSHLKSAIVQVRRYLIGLSMVVDRVGAGDLSRDTPLQSGRDILGIAINRMIARLRELVGEVRATAEKLADASAQLGGAANQTDGAVRQVTKAMQSISAGSLEVSRSAQTTNSAVGQLRQAIEAIARGAGEQARQVQAASAAATQMAARVEQVAAHAHSLAAAGEQTKSSAENGAKAVRDTVAGMAAIEEVVLQAAERVEELGKLGEKIGAVVETIDDIAEQTNLLALNAAIEAARAGEHGRSFAVVADEVRKLAERAQRETKAIAELIKQVQLGTRQAVSAMESGSAKVQEGSFRADQARQALEEILAAVDSTLAQVTEIASAAKEMAAGARSVVQAVGSISEVVEKSKAFTEQMTSQAAVVASSAEAVAAVSERNSMSVQEVSASTEEMAAQVDDMSARAQELAATADTLRALVGRFDLGEQVVDTHRSAATSAQPDHLRVVPFARKPAI